MNIWIRAFPFIEDDVKVSGARAHVSAQLGVEIYPDEKSARAATALAGGIAMRVEAESLRGQVDENGFLSSEPESGRAQVEEADAEDRDVIAAVVYSALPHTMETETCNEGAENEYTQSVAAFGPEATAWLDEVEKATGMILSQ